VKRGEVWTAAGGADYASKPRPAVIIQSDTFPGGQSVTICSLTTNQAGGETVRLEVAPTMENGLISNSRLMVDKVTTIPRTKLGRRIGRLSDSDLARMNNAIVLFLGLAG
jgi:mRNA interferase MazF